MRLVVIAGPTGTGKSDLSIDLAMETGAEIVNADSMQLYRGMDIGTAKVPPARRNGIPHHLLDVLDVTDTASVAAYQRHARAVIDGILGRGRMPILVGGSGLYLQSVIDDIEFPGTDATLRARLMAELDREGAEALHARLRTVDPAAATAIQPTNGRKIVRALEVIELTGQPFTATMPGYGRPRYDAALIGLDRDRADLDSRVARRVDRMMADGLLDEVESLSRRGLRDGRTASRALGYRQLLAALDGRTSLGDAVTDTITATRRFVRRQRSWFRRDPRVTWVDAAGSDVLDTVRALVGAGRTLEG